MSFRALRMSCCCSRFFMACGVLRCGNLRPHASLLVRRRELTSLEMSDKVLWCLLIKFWLGVCVLYSKPYIQRMCSVIYSEQSENDFDKRQNTERLSQRIR